jgi:4-hydroxy-4-methyl-2-oxoglutarate aldolase
MTGIPAIEPAVLVRYEALTTSFIADGCRHLAAGSCMDDVLPLLPGWRFAGRVRTMRWTPRSGTRPQDDMKYKLLTSCQPGDVIVIATGGSPGYAVGDNVANTAKRHGARAMVTDGRARDVTELRQMQFPIFCRGPGVRKMSEMELVAIDVPVDCGGAFLQPGDLIAGDADGIVVVPQAAMMAALSEAEHVRDHELEQAQAIQRGASVDEIEDIIRRKRQRKGPALQTLR